MDCAEIDRIINLLKDLRYPQELTGPLSVLAAFQCRGFTEVFNERTRLVRSCDDAIWRMRQGGDEPHDDVIRLIDHLRM